MQKIAIIIPCYNEEKRIDAELVASLLASSTATIFLCNDGSTDDTLNVLNAIAAAHNNRCFVIHSEQNRGKANTIYSAANKLLLENNYSHIGYFDADFSTPPAEIVRLLSEQENKPEMFILGSRVLLLNTKIKRKLHRHIIGRFIVTIVNLHFKLGVYDTQCGAKLFPVSVAKVGFAAPFKTSWLFDIEIFIRLKKGGVLSLGKEVPLTHWTDVEGSKLSWKTTFKILRELYILTSNYNIKVN
jgi:dolichyl-phosphate beta-glucosyltransferase